MDFRKKLKENKKIILFLAFFSFLLFIYFYLDVSGLEKNLGNSSIEEDSLDLPFIGEVNIKEGSLVLISLVIGLLDGFNPCAMWVLIYLITLVSQIKDRRKMWFIVGTFLLASGIMYFAILALWLAGWQMIAFLGFSKWIMIGVGAFALWFGFMALYDFYKSGGKVVCEVGDINSRRKTSNKIKEIVNSPLTFFSVFAVIALAFAVNSIEFVCSAGLPAIFTQVLSVADVGTIMNFVYISIYTLAFMADDLLIFSLALMAIDSDLMQKYSGLSKLIGGLVMIGIGIVLLFFPNLLL